MRLLPILTLLAALALFALLPAATASASSPVSSVYDRGLVTDRLTLSSIVSDSGHSCTDRSHRHFVSTGPTLAYITPWNRDGFTVALKYREKFDFLAPVWFQVKIQELQESNQATAEEQGKKKKKQILVQIEGGHGVDLEWLKSIRTVGSDSSVRVPRVVPRYILEASQDQIRQLSRSPAIQNALIDKLQKSIIQYDFDGLTLEMTEIWPLNPSKSSGREKIWEFIERLGAAIHAIKDKKTSGKSKSQGKSDSASDSGVSLDPARPRYFILISRPFTPGSASFGPSDFQRLHPAIDYLHIMTYDYGQNIGNPADRQRIAQENGGILPSAPLKWINETMRGMLAGQPKLWADVAVRSKLMMGLPFYGMFYSREKVEPIVGRQFVEELGAGQMGQTTESQVEFHWNANAAEHIAVNRGSGEDMRVLSYPSLLFLDKRLRLAEQLGIGVGIWEIGQGLEYFYDLL